MKIAREFVINSNGFTQTELKFALILLQHYQNNKGEFNENYIVKAHLLHTFKTANSSKLASKTVNKIRLKDEFSSIFSSLYYEYPGIIKFRFKQEIEDATDTIEFDETLLTTLPNTGITLKLLLLLLFAIKDNSFDFTIDRLATALFGNKSTYNPQHSHNASANQQIKLQQAVDELNNLINFFVSFEPIKSSRNITGFHFNVSQTNPTAICTDADTITKLLRNKKFDNVPQFIAEFIAMFATKEEAKAIVQYITQKTAILQQTGIINKENDICLSLARYAVLFPHKTPTLWYTEQRAKTLLEHYMILHPKLFVYDIIKFINDSTNHHDLAKIIKQNKKEK